MVCTVPYLSCGGARYYDIPVFVAFRDVVHLFLLFHACFFFSGKGKGGGRSHAHLPAEPDHRQITIH